MGHGRWDDAAYRAAASYRRSRGLDDFGYSADLSTRPRDCWQAHPSLDPCAVRVRESRDSPEHPLSTPIIVLFDVTGSMGTVPRTMQRRLGQLHGLLVSKDYARDPQILFGAIGDADCDRVPLQIGQFESDNRMDEQLRTILIEGGGGGQQSESYELAAYFVARHVETDAWTKRGRKGYLFIVGDEMNKHRLPAHHIDAVLGEQADSALSVESIYAEVQQRWHTFFVLPRQTHYYDDPRVAQHWQRLLGERVVKLEDPDAVCEVIAVTVGLMEDSVGLADGLADLQDAGSTSGAAVGRALADVVGRDSSGRGSMGFGRNGIGRFDPSYR